MTTTDPIQAHAARVAHNIDAQRRSLEVQATSARWLRQTHDLGYDYNFQWFGRPVLQLPQDLMALQEIVFEVQPDVILETGIAHGGSMAFFASMLHLLNRGGIVVGIDIEIRAHNRRALEAHPLAERMRLVEGPSTDAATLSQVADVLQDQQDREPRVMVVLDSDHTHAHVLRELELYAPLVSDGSYLVVCDTAIEDLGDDAFPDREWGPGNSPKSAIAEFLARGGTGLEVDTRIDHKLLLTNSPGGYLRCRR